MRIELLFTTGGESREAEKIDIAEGARLKHVLMHVKQRGDWNGVDRLKVWVNGHPKNDPMKDKEQQLEQNDFVTVELPQTWQVD